ncbi:MAG TPA: hypothetical protein VF215_11715 [Thermoanaerobaculia bacterium]
MASYLVDSLSEDDRTDFEMHYIDCPICAEAVYRGTMDAEKPLVAPIQFRQRVQQWMSVAAAAVLAFGLGVLGRPGVQPPPAFVFAENAGAVTGVVRGVADAPIVLHFDGDRQKEIVITNFPADPAYQSYEVALRYASGKLVHADQLTRKQALVEEGVPMLLNPLPVGRYVLETRGVRKDGNRSEPSSKSVVVVQ